MKEIARRSATVRLWNPGNPGWWLLVVFTAAGAWVLATGLAPAFQRFAVTGALAVLLSAPMFVLVWFLVKGMQIVTRPARSAALAAVIWGAVVATGVFALNANGAVILLLAQHVSLDFANEWGAAIAAPLTEETGKLLGVVAESQLDRIGFVDIAQRGGGAVRVEVLHLVGVDTGIAQRGLHRTLGAVHIGCCHVVGISAHAEADQFGVDLGAARLGVLVLLEHHHAGTLAQHETVAVLVPGT